MKNRYILGIETSCDETAAAVLDGDGNILSNVVASQIDIHKEFGGVVPELAARNHTKIIDKVVAKAIRDAGITAKDITDVAATTKPGLPGAVMVGRVFGDVLASALKIPFYPINHVHGHIASVMLAPMTMSCNPSKLDKLAVLKQYQVLQDSTHSHLALVVSGGHTSLYKVEDKKIELLEGTVDDAIGESFDKVGRILGLDYPAGPRIDKIFEEYKGEYIDFVNKPKYEVISYSGLKTAVLNYVNKLKMKGEEVDVAKIASSFQREAVNQLIVKALSWLKKTGIKVLTVSGGVSANKHLRERLQEECAKQKVEVFFPPLELCGDNAAMIAAVPLLL